MWEIKPRRVGPEQSLGGDLADEVEREIKLPPMPGIEIEKFLI